MVFCVAAPRLESEDYELDTKLSNRGFDLMSHEIIEQRLENLKRKPKWSDWLDAFIAATDDVEMNDDEEWVPQANKRLDHGTQHTSNSSGFVSHLIWSILAVLFAPFIILFCAPFKRFYRKNIWPLGCSNPLSFIQKALMNLSVLFFSVALAYWKLVGEIPTSNVESDMLLVKQHGDILSRNLRHCFDRVKVADDASHRTIRFIQSVIEGGQTTMESPISIEPECSSPFMDLGMLLAILLLFIYFYKRWSRIITYGLVVYSFLLTSDYFQSLIHATSTITSIDPQFAMLDEEVVITIEGSDLLPGGSIAWIPYWCSSSTYSTPSFAGDCDKQFESTYNSGVVYVTFKQLDTYIPCYKAPPNPRHANDFICFNEFNMRVKDQQSIPGLSQPKSSSLSKLKKHIDVELTADLQ